MFQINLWHYKRTWLRTRVGLLMESETMPTSPLAEPLPSITATIVGFSTVELSPPPFTLLYFFYKNESSLGPLMFHGCLVE